MALATENRSNINLERTLSKLKSATHSRMLPIQVKLMGNLPNVHIQMYESQFRQRVLEEFLLVLEHRGTLRTPCAAKALLWCEFSDVERG